MKEAMDLFKDSEFMKEVLGHHIFDRYLDAKQGEWESYQKNVSQWEIDEYLYKI